jgi:membrane protease YdiL (CAAX protease family)
MRNRIKWILAGVGFTFGLQVLISLIFTGVAYSAARPGTSVAQGTASIVVFGFAIGAYLVGGFVVGWMNEKLRIGDGVLVGLLTLILTAVVYVALPGGNKGQFVNGILLTDPTGNLALSGKPIAFIALAILTAVLGSYIGWHATVPQEGVFDRVALALGLIGAIVGPFILLAVGGRDPNNPDQRGLPWYFLAIVLVLVLVIIAVGFLLFARASQEGEEISISPDRRKEP